MTETELKKLIEDCCNDIFDRLEPLANVKSRLYQTLKPAINYTRCCKSDSELLDADFGIIVGKEAHFYKDGKIFKKEKLKFSD